MPGQNPFILDGQRELTAFAVVSASDTVNQAAPLRALLATGAGNAVLVDVQGNVVTFPLAAGVLYRIPPVVRVNATGLTATGLIGCV